MSTYTDLCVMALNGELTSSDSTTTTGSLTITNGLPIALTIFWLSPTGEQWGWDDQNQRFARGTPGYQLAASDSSQIASFDTAPLPDGSYFVLTTVDTGAFVAVAPWDSTASPRWANPAAVDNMSLLLPGELGPPPSSTATRIIPGDGPRVLVGIGQATAGGPTVTREQYWRLSSDSYSMQAGDQRVSSITTTSGMESTSSSESAFSSALGLTTSASGSIGWASISASISANLSYSSSSFQQVTLNSQTLSYIQLTPVPPSEPVLVLFWQICDIITVIDSAGKIAASTVTALDPAIGRIEPLNIPEPTGTVADRVHRPAFVPSAATAG